MSLQARALHHGRKDAYSHDLAAVLAGPSVREQHDVHASMLGTITASADLRRYGAGAQQ
jgi:hypothetical protein